MTYNLTSFNPSQNRLAKKNNPIQHSCGYSYFAIICNRLLEILVLNWSPGIDSKPHSHQGSINLTKVISGQVLERKYHISGGQLIPISERIINQGQWIWTLPYEIHELVALDAPAQTMHFYFPGRLCWNLR